MTNQKSHEELVSLCRTIDRTLTDDMKRQNCGYNFTLNAADRCPATNSPLQHEQSSELTKFYCIRDIGLPSAPYASITLTEILHPDDVTKIMEMFTKAYPGARPFSITPKPVESSEVPISDDKQADANVVLKTTDKTNGKTPVKNETNKVASSAEAVES